jgi:hypothetical protein
MKRVPDAQASSLLATSSSSRIRTSLEPSFTSATCSGSSLEGTIITYIESFLCLASSSQPPSTFHQPQPTVVQPIWATTPSRTLMTRKVRYSSSRDLTQSLTRQLMMRFQTLRSRSVLKSSTTKSSSANPHSPVISTERPPLETRSAAPASWPL